jgi:hypothetical protein
MAKSYTRLFGISDCDEKELFSVDEVAEFICKEGKHSDVSIYQENGTLLLNTFGIFINKINDMEYREELLKTLIRMQQEIEDNMDSEDVGMGGM